VDADLRLLQGDWQAVRIETGAGPVPDETVRQLRYVFEGDRVTLFEGDRATGAGAVTLHPRSTPKAIDVEMTDGPGRGQVARGVYEVAEACLRLCIGPERPAGFSPTGPASLVDLVRTQTRQRPAEPDRAADATAQSNSGSL
jgi:uncharacterized protein (TIGR03067 family)